MLLIYVTSPVSVLCVSRVTIWYHVLEGTVLPVSVFQPKEQWSAFTQQPIRTQLDLAIASNVHTDIKVKMS